MTVSVERHKFGGVAAECNFCKAETELYVGGVPVCVKCSELRERSRKPLAWERQILSTLQQDLEIATEQAKAATTAFDAVTRDIPSALPHPDGTQRIDNASRVVSLARLEVVRAHNRLNDFLKTGVVPEDLKRSG